MRGAASLGLTLHQTPVVEKLDHQRGIQRHGNEQAHADGEGAVDILAAGAVLHRLAEQPAEPAVAVLLEDLVMFRHLSVWWLLVWLLPAELDWRVGRLAPGAELQIVRHALGDVPLVGFFAAGEIARNQLYGYTGVLTVFCTTPD